jgi:hypothetical protein
LGQEWVVSFYSCDVISPDSSFNRIDET